MENRVFGSKGASCSANERLSPSCELRASIMADVAPAAAPAADEAQPQPSSSIEYESEKKMNISVDGTAFDLTALLNFSLLQDMLRQLAQQQREQATLIRGLRQDLEKANR